MIENVTSGNSTALAAAGTEDWAQIFGTVIIVIISSVCCCCGFGCIYRRYLEKKEQARHRTDVPDKSRASRTSARHSEKSKTKSQGSSKKHEYSRTLTNSWNRTKKKVWNRTKNKATYINRYIHSPFVHNLSVLTMLTLKMFLPCT